MRISRNVSISTAAVGPLAIAAASLLTSVAPAPAPPGFSATLKYPAVGVEEPLPADTTGPECDKFLEAAPPKSQWDPDPGRIVLCRKGYMLAFNPVTRVPDWVIERLSPQAVTGKAERKNNFRVDDLLADKGSTLADYKGSSYDRGHQAPAADAASSQLAMDETFFLSNMAPQVGKGFNQGAWRFLEDRIRNWVLCGGHKDLFVITGPIFGSDELPPIGNGRVHVPARFFKIIYDPVSRRGFGLVLNNAFIGAKIDDMEKYRQPIRTIEGQIGYSFFSKLTEREADTLKDNAGEIWGHTSSCPATS